MPRKNEPTVTRVSIDPVVLERIEATRPPAISCTDWVNYLVRLGLGEIDRRIGELSDVL